ncbi:MAG: hypothetical protein SFU86_19440 [Pirellulaceae bacterium]|nr:hypothetical protein [Pirellulaceae bacterium]
MSWKLPDGAESAFRIERIDAFDRRFAVNIYGEKRSGWYVATLRHGGFERDSGVESLPQGEWLTLLHMIDHCGFWALPADDSHLVDPNALVFDGEWLTISGRDANRYHRVHRFDWREQGLDTLLSFGFRISGFFNRHPTYGWTRPTLRDVESILEKSPFSPLDQTENSD